jgi:hypothetical protein
MSLMSGNVDRLEAEAEAEAAGVAPHTLDCGGPLDLGFMSKDK